MPIDNPPAAPNPLGTNFASEALAFTQWMHTAAPQFNTAVTDANQAVLDAQTEGGAAVLAAESARDAAQGFAGDADTARGLAVTAQGLAEDARDAAQGFAGAAEDARDMAQNYAAVAGAAAGLPALAGQALKNLRVKSDETGVEWTAEAAPGSMARNAKTSAYTLAGADKGALIDCTGTWTLDLTAAATLGAGWWCYVRNIGTGTITADPNGTELIDGVTSGAIRPGMTLLVQCDGAGFFTINIGGASPESIVVLSSGTSWTCPAGVTKARLRIGGAGGGGRGGNGSAAYGAGASGGYVEAIILVAPGASYAYAIGAGGTGGDADGGWGGNGGATTFTANGVTYSAEGGQSNYVNTGGSASGAGALTIAGSAGVSGAIGIFSPGPANLLGRAGGDSQMPASAGDPGDSGLIVLELYK